MALIVMNLFDRRHLIISLAILREDRRESRSAKTLRPNAQFLKWQNMLCIFIIFLHIINNMGDRLTWRPPAHGSVPAPAPDKAHRLT